MHGAPVFRGTRVPVEILFEFIADNLTVDEFLRAYPRVERQQVNNLLHVMADDIKINHGAEVAKERLEAYSGYDVFAQE